MRHIACFLIASTVLPACNAVRAVPAQFGTASAVARVAPSGVQNVGGCQIFPTPPPSGATGNDWWNQDISKYPVDPKSSTYIAHLPGNLHPDFGHEAYYGIPFNIVPASQPKVPVHFLKYASSSVPGPYPIPPNAEVEGQPRYHTGDRHLLVLQQGTCTLYEMWEAVEKSSGQSWDAANGAVFNLGSNKLWPKNWTSADAAGLPILPALIKCQEVAAGSIDHPLRVTFERTYPGFITPARHHTGAFSGDSNYPPMGARLRLKASFNISHFNRVSKIILTAMQKYGMLVADNGSNWYFQGQGGKEASCWNDNDLDQLKAIAGKNFEVVDTGKVQR
jgi:hypothetical protein